MKPRSALVPNNEASEQARYVKKRDFEPLKYSSLEKNSSKF